MLDFSEFVKVPAVYEAGDFHSADEGVRGVFLEGPLYRGRKTRIFAWYGLPKNIAPGTRVPGIVLLHGALGTAYSGWVKLWNDRGFAAIAPDIFGGLPARDGRLVNKMPPEHYEFSGPDAENRFHETGLPAEDQWPYHAVAAAMTAESFLGSLPEVDAGQIGLTGISRGGYTASLAACYDSRFRYVMPVYGCGGYNFTPDTAAYEADQYQELWNPDNTLGRARMPMLWVNGACDFSFNVKGWNHSTLQAPYSSRALRPVMPHGQTPGAEAPELEKFARAVTDGTPYPGIAHVKLDRTGLRLEAVCRADEKMKIGRIVWTRARGCWNDCVFRNAFAEFTPGDHVIRGELPVNWSAAYLDMEDEDGCVYTSEVVFRE